MANTGGGMNRARLKTVLIAAGLLLSAVGDVIVREAMSSIPGRRGRLPYKRGRKTIDISHGEAQHGSTKRDYD